MDNKQFENLFLGIKDLEDVDLYKITDETCPRVYPKTLMEEISHTDLPYSLEKYLKKQKIESLVDEYSELLKIQQDSKDRLIINYYEIEDNYNRIEKLLSYCIQQTQILNDLLYLHHKRSNVSLDSNLFIHKSDFRLDSRYNEKYNDPDAPIVLFKICLNAIWQYGDKIKKIIKKNPNYTKYTLEIIQLIAPVIAQKYAGIPALSIVGAITLLCKQGINNFLDS